MSLSRVELHVTGLLAGLTAVVDGNGGGQQVSAAVAVRMSGVVEG